MSESGGGVSESYVDNQVDELRREFERRTDALENEIRRLENEMHELARELVAAIHEQTATLSRDIEQQTAAVVGGVATNTLMLERTKKQIAENFEVTRKKLEMHTESDLKIKNGKKLSEAAAAKTKVAAFKRDMEGR